MRDRQRLLLELRKAVLYHTGPVSQSLQRVHRVRYRSARRDLLHDAQPPRAESCRAGPLRQHDLYPLPAALLPIHRLWRLDTALLRWDLRGHLQDTAL
jgi:hypothetical protein